MIQLRCAEREFSNPSKETTAVPLSCIQRPLNWESCGSALQTITYYVQFGIVLRRIGERKFIYLEEAAIGGHPYARYDLGYDAKEYDISERAVRHWIISAILGDDGSIKALMAA